MGIHIDVVVSERRWQRFFRHLFDVCRTLNVLLKQQNLLTEIRDLTVWKDIPVQSLGGKQLLHVPLLEKNWSSVERVIEGAIRQQLTESPTHSDKADKDTLPIFLPMNPLISYRLEGNLNVLLDDGGRHPIPFEIISTARMRYMQGHLYLRTYKYYGYEFADIFRGTEAYQVKNRTALIKILDSLKILPYISHIITADTLDAYRAMPYSSEVYSKDEYILLDLLLKSATYLRRLLKEGKPVPAGLTKKDLDTLATDIQPFRRPYIIRMLLKHPFYNTQLPLLYRRHQITTLKGSTTLRQDNFNPMDEALGTILKKIATAFQRVMIPKDQFEAKLREHLDEIKFND